MEGLSERQYAARVGLSRGAIQKAKLVGYQASLFVGQRFGLFFGKACGDKLLAEFQGIKSKGGHGRPRVRKGLSNMAAKPWRFKRPLTQPLAITRAIT